MLKSNRRAVEREILNQLRKKNAAAGIAVQNSVKTYMRDNGIIDTGRAINSVAHDSDETGAIIGSNLHYFPFIELGTRYQPARAPLVSGLQNAKGTLRQIYGS